MSRTRSENAGRSKSTGPSEEKSTIDSSNDPLRPSDHADGVAEVMDADGIIQPKLGPVGYLRFFWRQLTSMRTALILLLLLALAAVPGSLVPQRGADPNGVIQYRAENPEAFKVLDSLQLFDTYTSAWFSAIYLLLFISLIGCIIPRTTHHLRALRATPPTTPARLGRLVGHTTATTTADAETAIEAARAMLRRQGYRVERYDRRGRLSVSAERGYLRETGNLVFHSALVGILISTGIGGGFVYTGQKVIVQDTTFTNVRLGYDSITPGRFFSDDQLDPYSIRLDDFDAQYAVDEVTGNPQPLDFTASVSTRERGGEWTENRIKVNEPLSIGGTQVYLLGNGYAPEVTVRDPDGTAVYSGAVPFLPQDASLSSLGVIKVPDGLSEQVGLLGGFYPNPVQLASGAFASVYPNAGEDALLTFRVYTGDLGLDDGVAVNAYNLNTDDMTQIAGADADTPSLQLKQGDRVDLPDGLGSVEFTGYKRFVSLDIHHDPTQGFVLVFAILILAGLLTSLFIPRRRVWVTATAEGDGTTRLEYAGLARGDDPRLEDAIADLAAAHGVRLARQGADPAQPGPGPSGSVAPRPAPPTQD